MRTGVVEPNILVLNEEFNLPYITDLVAIKLSGPEKATLNESAIDFHEAEYRRLVGELQSAYDTSKLPEVPSESSRAALNDLLVCIRLKP